MNTENIELADEQKAFAVGGFLGDLLIYVLIALVIWKVFQTIRNKMKKKDESNSE